MLRSLPFTFLLILLICVISTSQAGDSPQPQFPKILPTDSGYLVRRIRFSGATISAVAGNWPAATMRV